MQIGLMFEKCHLVLVMVEQLLLGFDFDENVGTVWVDSFIPNEIDGHRRQSGFVFNVETYFNDPTDDGFFQVFIHSRWADDDMVMATVEYRGDEEIAFHYGNKVPTERKRFKNHAVKSMARTVAARIKARLRGVKRKEAKNAKAKE